MEQQRVPRRPIAQLHRKFSLSHPLASEFTQNTYYGCMSSAKQSAAASASAANLLQRDKEKPLPPPSGPKFKTTRQLYIGPHLEDPTNLSQKRKISSGSRCRPAWRKSSNSTKLPRSLRSGSPSPSTKVGNPKPKTGNIDKWCLLLSSTTKGAWRSYKRRKRRKGRRLRKWSEVNIVRSSVGGLGGRICLLHRLRVYHSI